MCSEINNNVIMCITLMMIYVYVRDYETSTFVDTNFRVFDNFI